MGHRFVETTQNYAVANDKQVETDFYAATEKLDGWTLLVEATEIDALEAASNTSMDTRCNDD